MSCEFPVNKITILSSHYLALRAIVIKVSLPFISLNKGSFSANLKCQLNSFFFNQRTKLLCTEEASILGQYNSFWNLHILLPFSLNLRYL